MAHGKQDQLYAPLETDDHPWLQDPSVSHVFAAQAPLVTHVQVGSVTAMACFANGSAHDCLATTILPASFLRSLQGFLAAAAAATEEEEQEEEEEEEEEEEKEEEDRWPLSTSICGTCRNACGENVAFGNTRQRL